MTTYSVPAGRDVKKREVTKKTSVLVQGRWTHHAFKMSHDGQTNIIHFEDGIELHQGSKRTKLKMDLTAHNPREFIYSPDSSLVAFWAPMVKGNLKKRIAVMKTSGLSAGTWDTERTPRWARIVYSPKRGREPFGMEWSPSGDALFVIERARIDKLIYTLIHRIKMPSGGKPKEIARRLGIIDFFMPPVSRFENGSGPSSAPYKIIFGAQDGLYLVDGKGRREERLSKVPAMGLHNLEWNPKKGKNEVLLYFRFPAPSDQGGTPFKGVWLVRLDKRTQKDDASKKPNQRFLEQLYDDTDIHTLWFSGKGKWATWAGEKAVYFRRPDDPPSKTVKIEILDDDEEPLDVRGAAWNDKETKLCFTAGNRIMIYDTTVKTKKTKERKKTKKKGEEKKSKLYTIATFKRGFGAEPRWIGDSVFFTVVEDAHEEVKKIKNTPDLGLPKIESPDGRGLSGGPPAKGKNKKK